MSLITIISLALSALLISFLLTRLLCSPSFRIYMLDHPNERSLHDRPVPRGGGLAILFAIFVAGSAASFFYYLQELWASALALFAVAAVSLIDDRYSVQPILRFAVHVAAAAAVIYSGFFLQQLAFPGMSWGWPVSLGVVFSAVFIVWMINLYNFMDGMDGFAGGMAVFGFGTLSAMGIMADHDTFAAISLIATAATAGFLIFNFPPARIFMGDVGSSTLGLLAAVLSLWGAREKIFPFWIALLVFSPFIVDATVTLLRRMLRGERIWQAHKSHYYQQLVQAGWGHRKTVLVEYGIMLGCGMTAWWGLRASANVQAALIAGWAVFYFLFFFSVSRLVARREKTGTP
jgi:UDP-N-acetylmuramyl pentapeptide phosphotransferase/UDP-N-acetylglucosamine-1-phosphate transferase